MDRSQQGPALRREQHALWTREHALEVLVCSTERRDIRRDDLSREPELGLAAVTREPRSLRAGRGCGLPVPGIDRAIAVDHQGLREHAEPSLFAEPLDG